MKPGTHDTKKTPAVILGKDIGDKRLTVFTSDISVIEDNGEDTATIHTRAGRQYRALVNYDVLLATLGIAPVETAAAPGAKQ